MYLPNPSAVRTGSNTRSIFEQSKADLNSEFSFLTGCCSKVKEPSLPYYLLITMKGEEMSSCLSQGH